MGKIPAAVLLAVVAVFCIIGFYQIYTITNQALAELQSSRAFTQTILSMMYRYVSDFLGRHGASIAEVGAALLGLSLLSMMGIVKLMIKYARPVMAWSIYFFLGALLVLSGLLFAVHYAIGSLLAGISVLLLVFVYRYRQRIRLAGIFLEMSAKALWREKQVLLISLMVILLSVFTGIANLGVLHFVSGYLQYGYLDIVIIFLVFLAIAWVQYSIVYLGEGSVIQITHDWYRNPGQDAASLGRGVRAALDSSGPILKLSFVFALLAVLRRSLHSQAQKGGGPGMAFSLVGSLLLSFAEGILGFVTYFSLPSIMIEKLGFKDSVKRSARLVWRHMIDVILGNSGVGVGVLLFSVPALAMFGAAGLLVGYLLFPAFGFLSGLVMAILFVVFGFFPLWILFKYMYAIYKTILYEYALDSEEGFVRKSVLPLEVRREFRNLAKKPGKRSLQEPRF